MLLCRTRRRSIPISSGMELRPSLTFLRYSPRTSLLPPLVWDADDQGGICGAEEPPGHGGRTAGGLTRSGWGGHTCFHSPGSAHSFLFFASLQYLFAYRTNTAGSCTFCVSLMPRDTEWLFVCCSLAAGILFSETTACPHPWLHFPLHCLASSGWFVRAL